MQDPPQQGHSHYTVSTSVHQLCSQNTLAAWCHCLPLSVLAAVVVLAQSSSLHVVITVSVVQRVVVSVVISATILHIRMQILLQQCVLGIEELDVTQPDGSAHSMQ
jgi:mannitol-specific phosphotransferase system IIBC component